MASYSTIEDQPIVAKAPASSTKKHLVVAVAVSLLVGATAGMVASPMYHKGETQLGAPADMVACTAACTTAEVACQAAAAAAIFDEPEGGIGCGVADGACETACGEERRRLQVTGGQPFDPHVHFWHEFQKAYANDPAFICHTPLHEDRD